MCVHLSKIYGLYSLCATGSAFLKTIRCRYTRLILALRLQSRDIKNVFFCAVFFVVLKRFLGRLLQVDLITLEGDVRPSVGMSVRTSVQKKFVRF